MTEELRYRRPSWMQEREKQATSHGPTASSKSPNEPEGGGKTFGTSVDKNPPEKPAAEKLKLILSDEQFEGWTPPPAERPTTAANAATQSPEPLGKAKLVGHPRSVALAAIRHETADAPAQMFRRDQLPQIDSVAKASRAAMQALEALTSHEFVALVRPVVTQYREHIPSADINRLQRYCEILLSTEDLAELPDEERKIIDQLFSFPGQQRRVIALLDKDDQIMQGKKERIKNLPTPTPQPTADQTTFIPLATSEQIAAQQQEGNKRVREQQRIIDTLKTATSAKEIIKTILEYHNIIGIFFSIDDGDIPAIKHNIEQQLRKNDINELAPAAQNKVRVFLDSYRIQLQARKRTAESSFWERLWKKINS